jgi:two-component system KDP operon response regulator KdpE
MSSKVLIIDDEPQVARVLNTVLTGHGYEVRTFADPEVALSNFEPWHPDLVISDLIMPRANGIEVCRRIRTASPVPVIIISVKDDERTKVAAFDAGADDYVTKPFGMDELLARIRVALRRGGGVSDAAPLTVGEFRIDFHERRVYCRDIAFRLTPKEFELFVFMARHPNRVIPHKTLLGAVWGEASEEQSEYLRVFMGQLRKKFESEPSNPRYLVTEPWVGYRFNPTGAVQ